MLAPPDKPRRTPDLARILTYLLKLEQTPNIAELLDDEDELASDGSVRMPGLKSIAQTVEREYQIDRTSRRDWEESTRKAMEVALQVRQPKNYPFQGAANIKYPLVTVAALQFGARAYPAIIDGNRVVKCQVVGRDDGIPLLPQLMSQLGAPMEMAPSPPGGMPAPGQPTPNMAPGSPPGLPPDQPGAMPEGASGPWLVPPGAKRAKADRVAKHMSWQLLEQMEEWEEDTDVLLHHIPIVGCAFRKVYWCEELRRNKSEMVPAQDFVVNVSTKSLEHCPRATHHIYLYPHEIEERQLNGTFLDVDLPKPASQRTENDEERGTIDANDEDAPHLFLEQHRLLDLDADGYREPYIVTIHKDSCQVVRIVANFRMDNVKDDGKRITMIGKNQYFVKYPFIPDPKGGFYDIGFGKLLESLGETIDTTINQMLDAGHLQNAGGGLIGTGIRFKKNKIAVTPGKYEQVEMTGSLKDQIYAHQFAGPSPVLFQLLGMMIDAARDITAVKDILTGDTGDKGVQTATTTLAQIEQGLKVFTAIYKRVFRSLKTEFRLLFDLNSRYLDQQEYFNVLDEPQAIGRSDYDVKSLDVIPVADPKMVTDMQRSARANVLMQIAGSPLGPAQNPVEALKRVYDASGMEEPEKLVVQQQGPSPQEQLALANLEAEVKQKTAQAANQEAQAQKTQVETAKTAKEIDLLEPSTLHGMHMSENQARLEAARIDTEREKIAQAERGHSNELGHKRMELAAKVEEGQQARSHQSKSDEANREHQSKTEKSKREFDLERAKEPKEPKEDKAGTAIEQMLKVMSAPIEITRGKDGKATGARRVLN